MIGRLWGLPLGAHALALMVVVGLAIALTGPGAAFFSDEGAVAVQARLLDTQGTWIYEPFRGVSDPEQAARPFENADYGTSGVAPYAKHPLYPVVLAELPGSPTAWAVVLSIAGLVGAALFAGLIVGQIDRTNPSLPRVALWAVGLASPLLFASGLVVAHTLAAVAAAVAVWAAAAVLLRREASGGGVVALLVAVAVMCGVGAMLRSEALFLAPAIAIGALLSAEEHRRVRALVIGGVAVAGAVVGTVVDRAWRSSIIGDALVAPTDHGVPATGSWLLDRLHGMYSTLVQAGYSLTRGQELLAWLAALLVVGAALAWRQRWLSIRAAVVVATVGLVLYTLRLVAGPTTSIPGFLVACPLLVVALVLLDRRVVTDRAARFPLLVAVVSLGAIVLTQYPNGGGLEWGWRYAGFVVPVLVPPMVWGAWQTAQQRPDLVAARRPVLVLALLVSLVPAVLSLQAQASSHDADREVVASMRAVADQATSGDQRPVVLSWNRLLPQILHPVFDDYEWVVPNRASVATYASRLADAGTDRILLVGPDAGPVVAELEPEGWDTIAVGPAAPYDVVVLSNSRS